ncbi:MULTISPECIES: hypothetical protein [Streptomyces]|uniref:hypothetical protein n=1 Tax=Streptomyces TaxID=1883 RepID=UPI002E29E769|nr:hypothetical protein [Streptomyces sp. NBC_00271]
MGVVLVAVLLIVGAVAAVAYQRRLSQPYGAVSDLDAEAEAHRWVERLGGSLSTLDARGNAAAAQALTDAAERHRAAQGQLVTARSGAQYAMASRTALEGLHYLRAARTSLGLDLPDLGTGAITARNGRVTVDGRTYAASPRPGDATPYYYPGGVVSGRQMPGGWYSAPWWKTALVAGAAGVGGVILADALLDGLRRPHGGGPMAGPDGFGGLGGVGDFAGRF